MVLVQLQVSGFGLGNSGRKNGANNPALLVTEPKDYRTARRVSITGVRRCTSASVLSVTRLHGARDLHGNILESHRLDEECIGADLREATPLTWSSGGCEHDDRRLRRCTA